MFAFGIVTYPVFGSILASSAYKSLAYACIALALVELTNLASDEKSFNAL